MSLPLCPSLAALLLCVRERKRSAPARRSCPPTFAVQLSMLARYRCLRSALGWALLAQNAPTRAAPAHGTPHDVSNHAHAGASTHLNMASSPPPSPPVHGSHTSGHESSVHAHSIPKNASARAAHVGSLGTHLGSHVRQAQPPVQPPPPQMPLYVDLNATEQSMPSYAYEDAESDDAADEPSLDGEANKQAIEHQLWLELDIDANRDEPLLKLTVILATVAVVFALLRAHCWTHHSHMAIATADVDGSLSPRLRADSVAELSCAPPDCALSSAHLRSRVASNDSPNAAGTFGHRQWSLSQLDVFSTLASRLEL